MKKIVLVGMVLGALLAFAAPAYAEEPPYPVCPILPVDDQAMDNNEAGFDVSEPGDYYLCMGVEVTVPDNATNLNGYGMLQGYHASPPWGEEGYTPIWAGWGE